MQQQAILIDREEGFEPSAVDGDKGRPEVPLFTQYLRDIADTPLLTREQEIELGTHETILALLCDRTSNSPHIYYPNPMAVGGVGETEDWVWDNFGRDPFAKSSMVQTAEGALNEINSLLVKVRSLAIDSANAGVNDVDALAAIQAEITNALATIDRIASNTQFGTKKLLDGSAGFVATSSNGFVSGLSASENTAVGTFSIANIDQNGQKGQVEGFDGFKI